ncbi:MAG: pentapeptide repeat-containing protein, partial [Gemmatimonadota bacterium]|nr:pentapeptide repeat-containing protein [Gemmatimonadota bacterium]
PRSPTKRASRLTAAWWQRLRPYAPAVVSAVVVPTLFGLASYAAINGVHRGISTGTVTEQIADARPALSLERNVPAVQALLPQLMSRFGVSPVAQLSETEVSTRLNATGTVDTAAEAKATGARLVGADLRFASAERVFLALGDLRYANLLGANLWSADLRGANVIGADLTGASLYKADMRKLRANAAPAITRAMQVGSMTSEDTLYCSRTSFAAANLRYARLDDADLRGASFDDAMLQGATLSRARLKHATFAGADLDGADFRGAYDLAPTQILAARHVDALYDPALLAQLMKLSPLRFAGYDADAIELSTVGGWLTGEEEPDDMSAGERRERDALIRRSFAFGPASEPSSEALALWSARGKWTASTGKENVVPHGCLVVRVPPPVPPPASPIKH